MSCKGLDYQSTVHLTTAEVARRMAMSCLSLCATFTVTLTVHKPDRNQHILYSQAVFRDVFQDGSQDAIHFIL